MTPRQPDILPLATIPGIPLATRPCGCDWDVRVFGHQYCWSTLNGWKHIVCRCATCPCYCHQREG